MDLRKGLVNKYYKKIGIDITVDELIVTVAGSESVNLALEITCDPGDEVIVLEPFYTNYNTFAFMNGLTLKAIPTDIRNGFQIPPIEEFEKAITDKTKVLILPFPNHYDGDVLLSMAGAPFEKVEQLTGYEGFMRSAGIADMAPVITSKNTFIAPFVNAEVPQYLVVEDRFPNGRPPLEKAGVYMTDRETVNKTETMKVTTCLNPLHTALAVYGCMLGYTSIAAEMKDPQLKKLVEGIGYTEGLPVVVDPGILSPEDFLNEVVEQRLPNPFIPDMPQRIATDTSLKVGIRFGETIKSYAASTELEMSSLVGIPLAIAEMKENGLCLEEYLDRLTGDGTTCGDPDHK